MCGRFHPRSLIDYIEALGGGFQVDPETVTTSPSYNFGPESTTHVIINQDGKPALLEMSWRFLPPVLNDSKSVADFKKRFITINAKCETLATSPLYRDHQNNRCLVLVKGWFEWSGSKGNKTPYYIRPKNNRLIALGGIYAFSELLNKPTFAVITTDAAEGFDIHHRKPLILEEDQFANYLGVNGQSMKPIPEFTQPYDSEKLEWWAVSKEVGKASFDCEEALEPVEVYDDQDILSGDWFC